MLNIIGSVIVLLMNVFTLTTSSHAAPAPMPTTLSFDIECDGEGGKTHPEKLESYVMGFMIAAEGHGYFNPNILLVRDNYKLSRAKNEITLSSAHDQVVLGRVESIPTSCPGDDTQTNIQFVANPKLKIQSVRTNPDPNVVTTTISGERGAFTFWANLTPPRR